VIRTVYNRPGPVAMKAVAFAAAQTGAMNGSESRGAKTAGTAMTTESAGMLLSAPGTTSTDVRENMQEQAAAANRPHRMPLERVPSSENIGRTGSSASFGRTGSGASFGRTESGAKKMTTIRKNRSRTEDTTGRIQTIAVRLEDGRPMSPHYHEYTFSNGDKYAGDWYLGMLTGAGVYTKPRKTEEKQAEKYEGMWLNDVLAGKGEHDETNGRIYEGEFKDGWRHGRGRIHLISKEASKPTKEERGMQVSRPATRSVTGPVVGKGGNPAAGQGLLEGAGAGFQCEWRNGVMSGKVDKVFCRLFENGKMLTGEDAHSIPGYMNTRNQHTGPIRRLEASRRYDVSAGGRRYEFPAERGGFNPALNPQFRPHTPRTKAMLRYADLSARLVHLH
jgi:hypothetical protein